VQLLTHDRIDLAFEERNAGGVFSAPEHLGAVYILGGPVSPGTSSEEMMHAPLRNSCPFQQRAYRSRMRPAWVWKGGRAGRSRNS